VVDHLEVRGGGGGVPAADGGGGGGGGRAVVAAASAGSALRAAGRARATVPIPRGLHARDGGAHGGGHLEAHVATGLAQRAPPGARLLPLLEEDLRYACSSDSFALCSFFLVWLSAGSRILMATSRW
jgi:hypothetical protein